MMRRCVRTLSIGTTLFAVSALLSIARPASACVPVENPAVPGEYVGCCDSGGNLKAAGSVCIGQTNPGTGRINTCMKGVCTAGGVCGAPFTGVDSSSYHPRCVDPGNTCVIGECYSTGVCKNVDNSSTKGKLPRCILPPDTNRCTKDCVEVAAGTDPFGYTCNNEPDPLYFTAGFPCSIANGTTSCQRGTCNGAGTCNPTADTPVTCDLNLDECDEQFCEDLDPITNKPVCKKKGKPLGMPCDLSDPNDCHTSFCDGEPTNGTCRSHHEENEGFECGYGQQDCHFGLCSSGGGCNGNYLRATDYPCTDEGNACTLDTCVNTGGASTCYHYGSGTLNGAPCAADTNSCTADVCDNSGGGTCTHPNLGSGTACATDSNACTLDVCNGSGTCTHGADPGAQGQTCTNTIACIDTAWCQGTACVAHTCKTSGVCFNCANAPPCVDNTSNSCGCQ